MTFYNNATHNLRTDDVGEGAVVAIKMPAIPPQILRVLVSAHDRKRFLSTVGQFSCDPLDGR